MDEQIETQLLANLWSPDAPDFRDLTLESDEAIALKQFVDQCDSQQSSIDLRDVMPSVVEPVSGVGEAAHAACSLVEYFRQLCEGDTARLSRSFLHRASLLLHQKQEHSSSSLRAVLKTMRMLGIPPASLVRYVESTGKCAEDSPICYQFGSDLEDVNYFRVDHSNENLIERIKSLLKSGIPCIFGMSVPSSFSIDARIELRSEYDSVVGYTAGVIVGFDDSYRISSTGAFSFQSSFSASWGEEGYGWLSYELFRKGMIADVWTAMQPSWLSRMSEDRGFRFVDEQATMGVSRDGKHHPPVPKGFPGRIRPH